MGPRLRSRGAALAAACALLVLLPVPALGQREAPAALLAAARAVSREVAAIRRLEWLRPVDFQVSDRATIRRFAQASLDREMSPDQWAAYEALLQHCGLLPAGVDLRDLVVRLYAEQVAGYYEPARKTFYLADWLPRLIQRAVVAHEATHALQDQHYDLVGWMAEVAPTEDGALARAAVIEGDAMVAMLAYLLGPVGAGPENLPDVGRLLAGQAGQVGQGFPTFAAAPPALQRLFLFPYVEGSAFVQAGLREGGWAAIDSLYADPPASTEQILHPERYWDARDPPRSAELPAGVPGAPWISGSWGEVGIQIILAAALTDTAAVQDAARGWDGDRYALYRSEGGPPAFAWTLLWDTPRDAERFARAYSQAAVRRFPGPAHMTTGIGRFGFAAAGRRLDLRWSGDRVEVRENLP
ncbi:MAG TPA: hypothetical protein VJP59_00335 [Gemmatimonadota bacterium]|nr:hypothetical protein [Gemmatimonadota bacterium]